ncbi:hypothetical protein FYJ27_02505 [Anaerosalibacter bizertensis]|mgnify:CR=1 FL=1|uniref:Zn-finger containing protein n=1 Tax=Anaerosalibacter bizertensis TaxID=932217 RepID=A0A844FF52_9FIRM|nr:hypothetical protein [Anaerosalibacter bizertensis]MBV1816508.1 hypothetical protein [Bacteroidales bacterium MSK.15.36]HHV27544.1 hypothetical protein [Tissierellia bacterium]MBU5292460.1 hypothetical protein [Anaerosalibacter bizertensis]MCG4563897.1 hypothetical protein [Anaerosalibacter bizertensis]MCG4581565.1 hypothetical protein [Anaerosalibacter bizertensis]
MNWLRKFMVGRYGVDQLSIALIVVNLICTILLRFFNSSILNIFCTIISVIVIYRIFSKNISKRYQENIKFLNIWNPIKRKVNKRIQRIKDLKDYKYFKCSNCKQTLRVPRGKGKISITCPKCKLVMIKKS